MSDRPYPKILRTTEAADATLRTYARGAHLAPFEALILAIGLLRTKDEREAASERAYKFASLWHDIARKLWHRWRSGLWAIAREQNAADGLRRELASAREATRRADAEVERLTADLVTASEDLEAERRRDEAAHDALRAEIEATRRANRVLADKLDAQDAAANRLTRELASFRGGLDLATETIARVLHERDAALSELTEVRAALATKGATDRLAERVETIAAALPDDFEAKIAERAPGWKGTLPELRARVITLGFSRYDALATDAAKRAAERGR